MLRRVFAAQHVLRSLPGAETTATASTAHSHAAKKTLEEAGDKASDEEKSAIEAAIAKVEEVVQGDDKEAIDAAAKELSEASATLAQKLYAEQQAEEGQGEAAEQPADDAMDAEFEEVDETQKDGK